MTAWLEYENPRPKSENTPLHLLEEPDEPPEQPEIVSLMRESELLGIPLYQGTLFDMPYILRLEMRTAADAEVEFKFRRATNLALQVQYGKTQE